jgi:hypothetical protein
VPQRRSRPVPGSGGRLAVCVIVAFR